MKLKEASKIEVLFCFSIRILEVIILPVFIIPILMTKLWELIIDWLDGVMWSFGHKMLRISDEAKDGTIQNKQALKNGRAHSTWIRLKQELKV